MVKWRWSLLIKDAILGVKINMAEIIRRSSIPICGLVSYFLSNSTLKSHPSMCTSAQNTILAYRQLSIL